MTEEMLYVIGLGGLEDWDAGRGSLYWILDSRGKHALPVFTTPGKARDYWEANSGNTPARCPGAALSALEAIGII